MNQPMNQHTFRTLVELHGKTATGLSVPADVVAALGTGRKPRVVVAINDHRYRSTVAAYGEQYLLPLSAENRAAAGVAAGDEIEVGLTLDTEPRVVEVPDDLRTALDGRPAVAERFAALSYSNQRQAVLAVTGAKTPATRQRRIDKIIAELGD